MPITYTFSIFIIRIVSMYDIVSNKRTEVLSFSLFHMWCFVLCVYNKQQTHRLGYIFIRNEKESVTTFSFESNIK